MKRGTLTKTYCGPYQPFQYEARNNNIVYRGNAGEIAKAVGKSITWVREKARTGRFSPDGWQVIGLTTKPVRRRPATIFVASHPDDDPVIGNACEVASIIDVTEYSVRMLARRGHVSRKGWRIRKATKEEIEADEVCECE